MIMAASCLLFTGALATALADFWQEEPCSIDY